ncbi:ABC transporter permease [Rhodanobacter sp. UC4450_H17]|jgi:lipopolysaccharide transport system permease protein
MNVAYRLADPSSPYRALSRHFSLIVQIARRDVAKRYRGSFAGLFWTFFNPMLMLVIYTFVFGVIFNGRWNDRVTGHFQYAIVLFAGLNINAVFSECANRATTLIEENANYVKRVLFPLEALSWSTLGAALFHLIVSTVALLTLSLIINQHIPWTVVFFPVVVTCFLPFMAGAIWLLASLAVYLRDIRQVVSLITVALMFLAPILYPKEMIPENYRYLLYLNPLTVIAEASQDVLLWGKPPVWSHLAAYTLVSSIFAWGSFAWFEQTKKGFADVL